MREMDHGMIVSHICKTEWVVRVTHEKVGTHQNHPPNSRKTVRARSACRPRIARAWPQQSQHTRKNRLSGPLLDEAPQTGVKGRVWSRKAQSNNNTCTSQQSATTVYSTLYIGRGRLYAETTLATSRTTVPCGTSCNALNRSSGAGFKKETIKRIK